MFSFKRQSFDKPPFSFERPGWKLVLATRVFIFCAKISIAFGFLLFFPFYFLLSYTAKAASFPFIGSIICSLIFLGFALFCSVVGGGKKEQRFYQVDTTKVICSDGNDTRLWQEPTPAYKGIHWHEEMHVVPGPGVGSDIANSKRLQVIYLVHSRPERTIKIIYTINKPDAWEICRTWAQTLNLPTFQKIAGKDIVYQPEDFDRSLLEYQKATQGEGVNITFDASTPPPRGIRYHRSTDHYIATLRIFYPPGVKDVVFSLVCGFILFLPSVAFIARGLKESSPWFFATGFIIALFGLSQLAGFLAIRKHLIVTHEEAVATIEFFGILLRRRTMALQEISQIYTIDQGLSSSVVLAGRNIRLHVGELSKETATWLLGFANAAVTEFNKTALTSGQKHL